MGDRALIAGTGAALGFIVVGFFLAGGHHHVRYLIRQRRYGGWL